MRGEYFILGAVTATKMNEAELIKEIVAEEARKRMLAGVQVDPSLISDEGRRTDKTVAKQVSLGGKDTYRKAEKIWDKAKAGNEKAKQAVKALDKDEVVSFLASIPG